MAVYEDVDVRTVALRVVPWMLMRVTWLEVGRGSCNR